MVRTIAGTLVDVGSRPMAGRPMWTRSWRRGTATQAGRDGAPPAGLFLMCASKLP